MQGHRRARADRVAAIGPRRQCGVWVLVGAALWAAAHAGSECFAVSEVTLGDDSVLLTADTRFASRAPDEVALRYRTTFARSDDAPNGVSLEPPAGSSIVEAQQVDDESLHVFLPAHDFAETGPGAIKMSFSGLDVDSLRSVAGGRMQLIAATSERGRLLTEARLAWLYEYLQTDASETAFYSPGDKGIFAVQGLSYGSNWALIGWGVRWELFNGWSAAAHYDAQANQLQLFHIGSGSFLYAW